MYLRVRNGQVIVTSPLRTTQAQVQQFVQLHKDWIDKQLLKEDLLIEEGTKTHLLDHDVTIHISDECCIDGNDLTLSSNQKKSKQFLLELLEPYTRKRFEQLSNWMGYNEITLKFGFYTSKWGSCQPKKKEIRLNGYLVFTDFDCIDAIIIHELAHLKQANHSQKFYDVVLKYMPNYYEVHTRLKQMKVPHFPK